MSYKSDVERYTNNTNSKITFNYINILQLLLFNDFYRAGMEIIYFI